MPKQIIATVFSRGDSEADGVVAVRGTFLTHDGYDYPDVYDWPESLLDEILEDHGLNVQTLQEADDPLALLFAAGFSAKMLRDRLETERIRTQKRCAD